MPVYLVTYDLIARDGEKRDYQPVYDALDRFPNMQALYSVFMVEAPSATAIRDVLVPVLRESDRFFVDRVRPNEHHRRVIPGLISWLEDHPLV